MQPPRAHFLPAGTPRGLSDLDFAQSYAAETNAFVPPEEAEEPAKRLKLPGAA